jgi:hypothetical protein
MRVVNLSDLGTGLLYPQEILLVLIPFKRRVYLRATVWPEVLGQWYSPMNPKGIEPATFLARSVAPQPTAPLCVPIATINSQNTTALTADIVKYELHCPLTSPACCLAIKNIGHTLWVISKWNPSYYFTSLDRTLGVKEVQAHRISR